jgi:hypothetical protein
LIFRLMAPNHALAAEKRAQDFVEHVFMTADDPALRADAQAMEEQEHVTMVKRLLDRTSDANIDWDPNLRSPSNQVEGRYTCISTF